MHMTLRKKEAITGIAFVIPFIIGFIAFYIAPFIVGVGKTFTFAGEYVGFENYADIFKSSAFTLAAQNTFKFIIVGVPLVMAAALLLSLLLYKKFRGASFFRSVFLLPLVLPIASIVMVVQVFLAESGVLNTVVSSLGLPISDYLHSESAFFVLVALYIWKNCGYNIVLCLAGLNAIPEELYKAARLDGANERQVFFSITLPLLSPTLLLTFIFSIMNAFKSFREAYLLCGDYPNRSIYMLQHFINNNFKNLNYPRLFIAALIIFAVIFVLVLIMFSLKRKAGDYEL